jgi:hypothetical protein
MKYINEKSKIKKIYIGTHNIQQQHTCCCSKSGQFAGKPLPIITIFGMYDAQIRSIRLSQRSGIQTKSL